MIGSLYAGISGLNVNATAMSVIGDNIANVNTTAFKGNSVSFASVLSQSLTGSGGNSIGRGVQLGGMSRSWTQGTLENTGSGTDLAINGKGFFMVQNEAGLTCYTRSGGFNFNADGDLVNRDNMIVQGYSIDTVNADGTFTTGAIVDVSVTGATSPPSATDEMSTTVNLDAEATSTLPDTYITAISVYDSLGNEIPLTITFTKNPTDRSWNVAASIPSTAGTSADITAGGVPLTSIEFDEAGKLASVTNTTPAVLTADPVITLTLTNGATASQAITWSLFDNNLSNGKVTGYAAQSATSFLSQDGYAAGALQGISIDETGVVTGCFTNGELPPLFQIALADFPNYQGLNAVGDSLYSESRSSGQATPGTAGNGKFGLISSSALEMSNVDLANEFVKMITTQRAFQASSRVITTSDEILQDLINLKR
ncbi:MAG: flagellar hook protein FlgE [Thermodesulfobacteriota bacterium]|nr:flagellar hook protein FlgE [Thermodesulfobacteriota bacterium]